MSHTPDDWVAALPSDALSEADFRAWWNAGGRKLDMGRSCLRYRRWDDLDHALLTETIASGSGAAAAQRLPQRGHDHALGGQHAAHLAPGDDHPGHSQRPHRVLHQPGHPERLRGVPT